VCIEEEVESSGKGVTESGWAIPEGSRLSQVDEKERKTFVSVGKNLGGIKVLGQEKRIADAGVGMVNWKGWISGEQTELRVRLVRKKGWGRKKKNIETTGKGGFGGKGDLAGKKKPCGKGMA